MDEGTPKRRTVWDVSGGQEVDAYGLYPSKTVAWTVLGTFDSPRTAAAFAALLLEDVAGRAACGVQVVARVVEG